MVAWLFLLAPILVAIRIVAGGRFDAGERQVSQGNTRRKLDGNKIVGVTPLTPLTLKELEPGASTKPAVYGSEIKLLVPEKVSDGESPMRGTARDLRVRGEFVAKMRQHAGKSVPTALWNLSKSGFSADWPHKLHVGDRIWMTLPDIESLSAIVMWTNDFTVGCKFEHPLHIAVFRAVVVHLREDAAKRGAEKRFSDDVGPPKPPTSRLSANQTKKLPTLRRAAQLSARISR